METVNVVRADKNVLKSGTNRFPILSPIALFTTNKYILKLQICFVLGGLYRDFWLAP